MPRLPSRRSLRKGLLGVGCVVGEWQAGPAVFGLAAIGLGMVLHGLSKATLRQNRELTTAGPYRFTRNPFYLANAAIEGGLLVLIGQLWLAVLFVPLWAIAYRRTILREEAVLRVHFGESFEAYAARVPRFLPTGRPLPVEQARGRVDPRNPNLVRGREYARLVGIALGPAVLFTAERVRALGPALLGPEGASVRGGLAMLLAGWLLKLGLGEALVRPERPLVPGLRTVSATAGAWRIVALSGFLAAMSVFWGAWTGGFELAALPFGCFGLCALDGLAASRVDAAPEPAAGRFVWPERILALWVAGALVVVIANARGI